MQAVADGMRVAEGGPIPMEYWLATSQDQEEANALFALDVSRHGGPVVISARDMEDV